jgi:SRSO17 transposase
VADWLEDVPSGGWQRLSAGEGAKGPRLYDWAWLPRGSDAAGGGQKGLLIRRKLAQPEAFTFYLTLAPEAAGWADLVRVAGTRGTIEAGFEAAKACPRDGGRRSRPGPVRGALPGLRRGRLWTGWHRHITLAMLAHAWLAVIRSAAGGEKRRGQPQRRSAAAHRAASAPFALAPGLGPAA